MLRTRGASGTLSLNACASPFQRASRSSLKRGTAALTLCLALAVLVSPARAAVEPETCAAAYLKGQEERFAGRLLSASLQFAICADASCPQAAVDDCRRWAAEVESTTPTISVVAQDVAGKEIADVVVRVDGAKIASERLSSPLALDAGAHQLRFEAPGFKTLDLELVLALGEHELPVVAVMQSVPVPAAVCAPSASPPPEPAAPFPTAAVSLASVGVLTLAGATYFGLSARSRYDELKSSCAPSCSTEQSSAVHRTAVTSDVLLAASIASFGAAAWLYWGSEKKPASSTGTGTALGVESRLGGAQLKLSVKF